jgi:hypothetical protein
MKIDPLRPKYWCFQVSFTDFSKCYCGPTPGTSQAQDCQEKADGELLDEADAATVILRELWNRLRETHRLRTVK